MRGVGRNGKLLSEKPGHVVRLLAKAMSKKIALPSAHDVARRAGVSQAAVSRAFNPGASISKATKARVIEAARELGYRQNLLARSLITGKSGIIGVVIGNTRNPFFLDALDALSVRLAQAGLHLLVFTSRADRNADRLVEDLLKFRVESLLLMSATLSSRLAEQCRVEGIPVVFFDLRSRTIDRFPSVTGANYKGAGLIAEHLIAQGYRRLAYIAGADNSPTSRDREAGFVASILPHGLPIPEKAFGYWERSEAMVAARELLSMSPRPDAIFAATDFMAFAAIEIARYEFGLEIGRDLGVAGFDDVEGATWLSFRLTTYSQPIETMIDKVSEILLNPNDFPDAPHVVIEGELKVRDSTRRG